MPKKEVSWDDFFMIYAHPNHTTTDHSNRILLIVDSAKVHRHLSQEGKPRHQKAQGLDQHHLQKTQDSHSCTYPQVR